MCRDSANNQDPLHGKTDLNAPVRLTYVPGKLAPWKLEKAKAFMTQRMARKCLIEDVAKACSMSRNHFSRAFKNATGLTPQDWLRDARLRKAEQMLENTSLTICQVAHECGFDDHSYFSRVFKAVNGVSPKAWRLKNATTA
jgi:transcriptional regulator GlxA family with amidase domain